MAQILKGGDVAAALSEEISLSVIAFKENGIEPTLAIVRLGERPDDISYERGAVKRAEKVGVSTRLITLPADTGEAELIEQIELLNADRSVHGVLMFRPLPRNIDELKVCNKLAMHKDVDGITDASLAAIFTGAPGGFAPCTAGACLEILDYYNIPIEGKRVVVVGRSLVIGKPVAMMLLGRNATVTMAHSRSADLRQITQSADILIACVGRAEMLDHSYLREGQIVIDVGINMTEEGKLVGDVCFADAENIVAAITPVPGGVGSVTTSVLMKHLMLSCASLL
jgi:methylenetetrahydrofolate dehydrogenase (NADP+)/methenyltetrahydrofolate cyclohydrolase